MKHNNIYKTADNTAAVFVSIFFGLIILLAVFWGINSIQQVIMNIFP
jgi:hypothetical protein